LQKKKLSRSNHQSNENERLSRGDHLETRFVASATLSNSRTTVDLTIRDTSIGGDDISFDDLVDILDAAFMVQVEAGRGKWSAFADITYLITSDTTERPLATMGKQKQNNILFGYQFKSAEFKDGDVRLDFTYGGPMPGFNFRF
jgi:hypothetical protein